MTLLTERSCSTGRDVYSGESDGGGGWLMIVDTKPRVSGGRRSSEFELVEFEFEFELELESSRLEFESWLLWLLSCEPRRAKNWCMIDLASRPLGARGRLRRRGFLACHLSLMQSSTSAMRPVDMTML